MANINSTLAALGVFAAAALVCLVPSTAISQQPSVQTSPSAEALNRLVLDVSRFSVDTYTSYAQLSGNLSPDTFVLFSDESSAGVKSQKLSVLPGSTAYVKIRCAWKKGPGSLPVVDPSYREISLSWTNAQGQLVYGAATNINKALVLSSADNVINKDFFLTNFYTYESSAPLKASTCMYHPAGDEELWGSVDACAAQTAVNQINTPELNTLRAFDQTSESLCYKYIDLLANDPSKPPQDRPITNDWYNPVKKSERNRAASLFIQGITLMLR